MATIEEWKAQKATQSKMSKYDPDRDAGDRHVNMANRLINAGHGLTLAEKRIVCLAVSKIDSRPSAAARVEFSHGTIRITAQEYATFAEIDMTSAYEQLRSAGDNLFSRQITYYEPAYIRKKRIEDTIVKTRWVSTAKYQKDEGWIELTWTPEVLQNLVGLKRNFTSYQLKQTTALRSIYSWRLLELLMKFKSSGIAHFDVEDLKVALDVPESMKNDFGQVRKKIIDPAIKELEKKDDWIIAYKTKKAGRRIDKIRFSFMKNPQPSLF